MTSLLKRLSISLDRRDIGPREAGAQSTLTSVASFNDFSFHAATEISQEVDNQHVATPAAMRDSLDSQRASLDSMQPAQRPMRSSPFVVGSAPTGLAPVLPRSAALKIPRNSLSHALSSSPGNGGESVTPRAAVSTPRRSEDMPASPRSPTSPTGRRRTPRSPKIDGMDMYDFCELLRSSSL